jgi:hypothetical protein
MTKDQPTSAKRDKPPRYLTALEWFCYFFIFLAPLIVYHFVSTKASGFEVGLLSLGVFLLGVIGLGLVMGRKHRYRL